MIGASQLALLREGAIFVNTARAWSVDQEALLQALETGRFWAALDIFEPEPLPVDSPFRKLENVLLTPHRAGYAAETIGKQGTAMVEELARFFAGQPLEYQVARESYAVMA
jgi:phosphoglycerate dehydrogenase-like enzyme